MKIITLLQRMQNTLRIERKRARKRQKEGHIFIIPYYEYEANIDRELLPKKQRKWEKKVDRRRGVIELAPNQFTIKLYYDW